MDLVRELKRAYTDEQSQVEENFNVTKAVAEALVNKEKVQFEGALLTAVLEAVAQFRQRLWRLWSGT